MSGLDSPSLRMLAGLRDSETEDAPSLFEKTMAELGWVRPRHETALETVVNGVLKAILAHSVPAIQGARELWDLSLSFPGKAMKRLHPFVYAASEWNERPEERGEIERWILDAARELIERD